MFSTPVHTLDDAPVVVPAPAPGHVHMIAAGVARMWSDFGLMADELLDAYEQTVGWVGARVVATPPQQLGEPTPCDAWDVAALLDHMIAGLIAYRMIAVDGRIDFAGLAIPDLATSYARRYAEEAANAVPAWRRPGVLDEPCKHPLGRISRRDALGLHHADLLLHGWDLAVATGQDATLGPDAAAVALDALRTTTPVTDELRRGGYWGTEQPADSASGVADRLLAFSGRTPPVAR
jgi:uncharacterized protein (TIGR03086 family)